MQVNATASVTQINQNNVKDLQLKWVWRSASTPADEKMGKLSIAITRGNLSSGHLLVTEKELGSDRLRTESRRVEGQPGVEVEPEAAVGIDVAMNHGRDASPVVGA